MEPSANTLNRCPHPEDCDEDGCTGHCTDVRRYGLVTDTPTPRVLTVTGEVANVAR